MNDRQSIIGFTEAELGFFLVLLCIVLWVTTAEATPTPPPVPTTTVPIHRDSLARLRAAQARLRDAERARDSLRRVVDSLKSPIWPSCRSRGVASGPLLSLIALGGGRYRLGADTVSAAGVAGRTAEARAKAEAAQCRHEVVLGFRADLSAPQYEASRRQLGTLMLRLLPGPEVAQ